MLVWCAAAGALAACGTAPPVLTPSLDPAAQSCSDWFQQLDAAVQRADVADAQEARIPGHPHLRADRFSAAMAQDPRVDDAEFVRDVLPRLRRLDHEARQAELNNLPDAAWVALGSTRNDALQRSQACGTLLLRVLPLQRSSVQVGDDYSGARRWLGLYALTRQAFTLGIQRHLADVQATFAKPLNTPADGQRLRYAVTESAPAGAFAPEDAKLLSRYQPVYEIDVRSDDDRPGAVAWQAGVARPVVQMAQPSVYQHVSFTRYRGQTLKQLVYTLWFDARTAQSPVDLLAGPLDALVWRVTLDPQGRALVFDSMHACGCYHYFLPTARATPLPAPDGEPEWAFVPQTLAAPQAHERVVLRIAARTHYLERATLQAAAAQDAIPLQVLRQDSLRSLPLPGADAAAARSVYGPDGLVAGSERAERWLFWPMGITSAGQMRQWGRHATAFVGRRHFDDADLFEKRFVFALAP
jgi:hypothetical protein